MENLHEEISAEVQEDINEAAHQVIVAKEKEHGIGVSVIQDIVVLGLEGTVIPEQESEELRARAEREGKTLPALVIEYVGRGLDDDAAFDRARRNVAGSGECGGFGGNNLPTLMN